MNPHLLGNDNNNMQVERKEEKTIGFESNEETKTLAVLTCLTCRMKFATPKDQRNHYKEDLHAFNLKRKVANLPPISLQTYNEKASSLATENQAKEAIESKEGKLVCELCSKSYSSDNQFQQHLKTKKHLENESKKEQGLLQTKEKAEPKPPKEPLSKEKVEEIYKDWVKDLKLTQEEEDFMRNKIANSHPFTENTCLFCNIESEDIEGNVDHMTKIHGFFIPDLEYLTDLKGLIHYLGQKIFIGNDCLYCNGKGKGFHTAESVQGHMRDMFHCKILYDDETEAEFDDFYDFSNDESALTVVNKGPVRVADNGCELIFADGRSVGHRTLKDYYKQNLRVPDQRESVVINKLLAQYRALGWEGESYSAKFAKQNRDPKAEKRQKITFLKNGIKGNNQKHHRDQIL
eukprot:TRINITY_DN13708_c0_g1_i1.p1 TRINITY_DN13708_c0_g1~~TRINITY_DN13708_c0_g1_i1.p1  ORF type:complete len:404 (-),score=121.88 TRINITY_DN13708_c0_g1_i1:76-1287(-)